MSFGKNIRGALSYNEQKVGQGTAELILASSFSRDINDMGFTEKLLRFEKLNDLNEKTKTNTLHLSLNFSPDDQLDQEKLQLIAMDYMEHIGFGGQPFLVYQHLDTNHPHLHILTTTIRSNGKAIYLHNLGKLKSEPARKELEIEYNLVKAEGRKQNSYLGTSTKISNIVSRVVQDYKFSSLEELNAILRQFNVIADRGTPDSLRYQRRGLVFSQIDKEGHKIGKPIKASSIYKSPTLSVLTKKFEKNSVSKIFYQNRVKGKVASALAHASSTVEFTQSLNDRELGCSVEYKDNGQIASISFVDHVSKTVFNCTDLGFTVPGILKKLNHQQNSFTLNQNDIATIQSSPFSSDPSTGYAFAILKTLLTSEQYQPEISSEFFKKKKKKKRNH